MLNKKICQNCYNEYVKKCVDQDVHYDLGIDNVNKLYDWEGFAIVCKHTTEYPPVMFITWPIPEKCPYVLEQTVSEPHIFNRLWTHFRFILRCTKIILRNVYLVIFKGEYHA